MRRLLMISDSQKPTFDVWVQYFNAANATTYTASEALAVPEMVATFKKQTKGLLKQRGGIRPNRFADAPSTDLSFGEEVRNESYEQLDIAAADTEVLDAVRSHPASTRDELSGITGRRRSTVCGAVKRLKDKGLIYESGSKFVPSTKRNQTTLTATPKAQK